MFNDFGEYKENLATRIQIFKSKIDEMNLKMQGKL